MLTGADYNDCGPAMHDRRLSRHRFVEAG